MGWSRRSVLAGSASMLAAPALGQSAAEPEKRDFVDYFSFIGSDAEGSVYLAHDNARGQTGANFSAGHWIMMWSEGQGIVPILGSQHYPNPGKVLRSIPDSEHFQFRGSIAEGTRMISASNGIDMSIGGLKPILRHRAPDNDFWIGAAPATLKWRHRTLHGRVIFEYIVREGFDSFTSDIGDNWKNFNGLYLLTEDGRDVYVRYHEKEVPGMPRESGMATIEQDGVMSDIDFRITESVGVDFRAYRWPTKWVVDFTHNGARWRLVSETMFRQMVADWEWGGFAMSIITGELAKTDGTARRTFKGWAELLI